MIYEIVDEQLILIVGVGHRREAYRTVLTVLGFRSIAAAQAAMTRPGPASAQRVPAAEAMDLLGDRDSGGQAVRTSGLITHPG